MRIPNAGEAIVSSAKLTEYLLAPDHPIGGAKARFFRAHGFNETNTRQLEAGLLTIALSADADPTRGRFGTKYVADGDLPTPLGGTIRIRTVWIVEPTSRIPRFVTAYPVATILP